ncbi:hypothetical protein N7474_010997 [Penicillium riverlandense]|uniref:uncharacterized protein n=1 Tax=Penicillium riverlandense TaxID=1903569 RepID=UPI002547C8F2|nr:uncharacterized protein N7474_010997 [Penicillium riverlandense]KAJ5805110.1 hypothetical protein N7474_010997 [Penicillium riverlandense]
MESSSAKGLVALPQEIIEAILVELGSSSFRPISHVCRSLRSICLPFLYRSIVLRDPNQAEAFLATLSQSPHSIPLLVRELQIHYHNTLDEKDNPTTSPEHLDPLIMKLSSLESLVIKSDFFDYTAAEKISLLRQPELFPSLTSCHIGFDLGHFQTWYLFPYEELLFHPSLQSLTFSGAAVQTSSRQPQTPRSTQLEELRFLNCDLHASELADMLRFPRALKHFTLKGQGPDPIITPRFSESDRTEYLDALKPHALSLESLDLDLDLDWEDPLDMRDFVALKRLTITPRMVIGDDTEEEELNGRTRFTPWKELLPQSLTHLTFRNDEAVFPLDGIYDTVRDEDLPNLTSFTCEMLRDAPEYGVSCTPEELLSKQCHDGPSFSQAFGQLGVQLSVVQVNDPVPMVENEHCPCPCWTYRHRFRNDVPW